MPPCSGGRAAGAGGREAAARAGWAAQSTGRQVARRPARHSTTRTTCIPPPLTPQLRRPHLEREREPARATAAAAAAAAPSESSTSSISPSRSSAGAVSAGQVCGEWVVVASYGRWVGAPRQGPAARPARARTRLQARVAALAALAAALPLLAAAGLLLAALAAAAAARRAAGGAAAGARGGRGAAAARAPLPAALGLAAAGPAEGLAGRRGSRWMVGGTRTGRRIPQGSVHRRARLSTALETSPTGNAAPASLAVLVPPRPRWSTWPKTTQPPPFISHTLSAAPPASLVVLVLLVLAGQVRPRQQPVQSVQVHGRGARRAGACGGCGVGARGTARVWAGRWNQQPGAASAQEAGLGGRACRPPGSRRAARAARAPGGRPPCGGEAGRVPGARMLVQGASSS